MDDTADIQQRRNSFIGPIMFYAFLIYWTLQLNFNYSSRMYVCSFYGCELWSLDNIHGDNICVVWGKALRHILQLPYNNHSYLLPILSDTLPIFDDICKRSMRFIANFVASPSLLVKSISWHCIFFWKAKTFYRV